MNSNIGHKTMSVLLADLIIKTIYFNVSWTFIDRFIYSSKNRGYLMYSKSRGKKKDLVYSRERFKNNEFLMPCPFSKSYTRVFIFLYVILTALEKTLTFYALFSQNSFKS